MKTIACGFVGIRDIRPNGSILPILIEIPVVRS
jgi:hypothetical protein